MTKPKPKSPAIKSKRWYQAPPGKPKLGLTAVVRRRMDPNEYFEFMLRVARDEHLDHKTRMVAWQHLAERGWGKSMTTVTIDAQLGTGDGARLDLSGLDQGELEAYEATLMKLTAGADGEGVQIIDMEERVVPPSGEEESDG